MKKSKLGELRNEISVLRDLTLQIVNIREASEDLPDNERKFIEKEIKTIIDKYKEKGE